MYLLTNTIVSGKSLNPFGQTINGLVHFKVSLLFYELVILLPGNITYMDH